MVTDENKERLILEDLRHELTSEEMVALREWVEALPAHRQEYEEIRQIADRAVWLKGIDRLHKERGLQQIRRQLRERQQRQLRFRWMRYVAAVVLPLAITLGIYFSVNREQDVLPVVSFEDIRPGTTQAMLYLSDGQEVDLSAVVDSVIRDKAVEQEIGFCDKVLNYRRQSSSAGQGYNRIVVPRGGEYQLVLADGTRVWLNSETEIKYPVAFAGEIREVFLRGEAYFEVEKAGGKRFHVVMDGGAVIEVTGTSFNASCYPDEGQCSATLASGKINLLVGGIMQPVQVGEHAAYNRHTGEITVADVDLKYYTSWRMGKFYFHDTPLEQIVRQLGRWYNVDFVFADDALKQVCFSGVALRDKPIGFVLNLLETTQFLKFTMLPDGKIRVAQR